MENIIKKHKEYQILKKIYDSKKITIQPSEKPDFIIGSGKERFGVEITEYYYNESSARLKNYKGYGDKILNSNPVNVLDKRDKETIHKIGLYVKAPEQNKYDFFMNVIQLQYNEFYLPGQEPKFKDVENQIINIIRNKDKKSANYEKRYTIFRIVY